MTPKEKAKELINKFGHAIRFDETSESYFVNMHSVKECALIAVKEIILANPHSNPLNTNVYSTMEYWNEVKHEIEKQVNNEIEKL